MARRRSLSKTFSSPARSVCTRSSSGIAQIDRKRTQVELNKVKTFVEMLHVKFADRDSESSSANTVDPGMLMKLVSRNTKRGAQFTPQGVLRWPLSSAKAEDVLRETRELLGSLDTTNVAVTH